MDKGMIFFIGFFLGIAIACIGLVILHIRELWSDLDCIRRQMEQRNKRAEERLRELVPALVRQQQIQELEEKLQ